MISEQKTDASSLVTWCPAIKT